MKKVPDCSIHNSITMLGRDKVLLGRCWGPSPQLKSVEFSFLPNVIHESGSWCSSAAGFLLKTSVPLTPLFLLTFTWKSITCTHNDCPRASNRFPSENEQKLRSERYTRFVFCRIPRQLPLHPLSDRRRRPELKSDELLTFGGG